MLLSLSLSLRFRWQKSAFSSHIRLGMTFIPAKGAIALRKNVNISVHGESGFFVGKDFSFVHISAPRYYHPLLQLEKNRNKKILVFSHSAEL